MERWVDDVWYRRFRERADQLRNRRVRRLENREAHRKARSCACSGKDLPILPHGNRCGRHSLPTLHESALKSRVLNSAWLIAALVACTGAASDNQGSPRAQAPLAINQKIQCRITRIADGDTVYCGNAGRIRLLMIDAPELSQGSAGREAARALADLMPVGTSVTVETDVTARDQYNRILGYIYLMNGEMVNEEMARSGYVTALVYPPNVRYVERIRAAVADARKAKRGLWATNFFDCSPRDYRAGRCGGTRPPDSRNRLHHPAGSS
jgi:micrococcal nuclease